MLAGCTTEISLIHIPQPPKYKAFKQVILSDGTAYWLPDEWWKRLTNDEKDDIIEMQNWIESVLIQVEE